MNCTINPNQNQYLCSVDPDEMAHNEPSHQDLHCHSLFYFRLKPLFASVDMSNFKEGRVHFRNSRMKGLMDMFCNILSLEPKNMKSTTIYHGISLTVWPAVVMKSRTAAQPDSKRLFLARGPDCVSPLPPVCVTSIISELVENNFKTKW